MRNRIYAILEVAAPGDRVSRIVDAAILSLIVANVAALILESLPAVQARYGDALAAFETFSVIAFTIEFAARLWSCTADRRYAHPVRGRLRFAATPLAIVDLLAVLPFYLPLFGVDLRAGRILRLFRIFRVAKLARYSRALQSLGSAVHRKRDELVVTISLALVLLVISASLMYFAEHEAQPEVFGSIPAALWWAIVTLTTVGYGDVYPVTLAGRAVAGMMAMLAVGMIALPTGVLGSAFVEEVERHRAREESKCPHCGKVIEAESTAAPNGGA